MDLMLMSPAIEQKACEAWAALIHEEHPVPPGVAIDLVQDEAGDRDDAVQAVHWAAALWLDARRAHVLNPDLHARAYPYDFPSASQQAAIACRAHLLSEDYSLAEACRKEVEVSNRQQQADLYAEDLEDDGLPSPDLADALNYAGLWLSWCNSASFAIQTCRAVSGAAYPQ
jgi:hypothetical protein